MSAQINSQQCYPTSVVNLSVYRQKKKMGNRSLSFGNYSLVTDRKIDMQVWR